VEQKLQQTASSPAKRRRRCRPRTVVRSLHFGSTPRRRHSPFRRAPKGTDSIQYLLEHRREHFVSESLGCSVFLMHAQPARALPAAVLTKWLLLAHLNRQSLTAI